MARSTRHGGPISNAGPADLAALMPQVKKAPKPTVARTKRNLAKGVAREAKAPEPKPCGCGCGATTKGGRFAIGHDARHVSNLVKRGLAGENVQAEVSTLSPALQAKFDKGSRNAATRANEAAVRAAKAPVFRRTRQKDAEGNSLSSHMKVDRLMDMLAGGWGPGDQGYVLFKGEWAVAKVTAVSTVERTVTFDVYNSARNPKVVGTFTKPITANYLRRDIPAEGEATAESEGEAK